METRVRNGSGSEGEFSTRCVIFRKVGLMIDEANLAIRKLQNRIRRENEHRYAFYRMLHATDRVLWQLEEMNRDAIRTIPGDLRATIREELVEIPTSVIDPFRHTEVVQEVLDSIFEVQERLFRWKDPSHESDDDEGRLAG